MTTETLTTEETAVPEKSAAPAGQASHTTRVAKKNDLSIDELIEQGRSEKAASWGAWLLSAATCVTFWASFAAMDWGFLGWVCLVPILLLVRLPQRTRWMYRALYAGGLICMLASLQWMRLGDPSMYIAWFALSIYLAFTFPVYVALCRTAVHRFRMPFVLSAALIWVGIEFSRSYFFTGFSWYFISHTQYRWLELIQISDLVGAYGVSFVVLLTTACIAMSLPTKWLQKLSLLSYQASPEQIHSFKNRRQQILNVGLCTLMVAFALGYGVYRRAEYRQLAETTKQGPRISLIQGNFLTSLRDETDSRFQIMQTYDALTAMSVRHQPDLIVWPESMYPNELLEKNAVSDEDLERIAPAIAPKHWHENLASSELADLSRKANAALVIGTNTYHATPERVLKYNSAAFVTPHDAQVNHRYDKMHRVIFGEYIPLRETFPWLQKFTPYADGFGIHKGEGAAVFNYGPWTMSPIICYEDTVPQLVRRISKSTQQSTESGEQIDVFVNLTNDGWFHPKQESDQKYGSAASEQHLITAAFRTVETRTPMVRAVNTGVSAFIDGEGRILEPDVLYNADEHEMVTMRDPATGKWREQFNGVLTTTVPLDPRDSLYVKTGDWFAGSCGLCCVFLIGSVFFRKKQTD